MQAAFGGPPVDPDTDLRFLGADARTPYLAEFSDADGGKPAATQPGFHHGLPDDRILHHPASVVESSRLRSPSGAQQRAVPC